MIKTLTLLFVICVSGFAVIDCNNSTPAAIEKGELEPMYVFPLSVNEPSGLTYNSATGNLFTVEDGSGGQIYEISTTGEVVSIIQVSGDDMEGIAINSTNDTLLVIEEKNRVIVKYTLDGVERERISVFVSGASSSGLEGIAIHPTTNHIYVLNEKNPRQLIELTASGNQIRAIDIVYADDLSGLCFNISVDKLLMVSDESESLYEIDLNGKLLRLWTIPVEKAEGVAVDKNGRIYIVSDKLSKLYVFEL